MHLRIQLDNLVMLVELELLLLIVLIKFSELNHTNDSLVRCKVVWLNGLVTCGFLNLVHLETA